MEAIGSSLMLIILVVGLLVLVLRKARKLGLVLISVALLFLYVIPWISFSRYKQNTKGTYVHENGSSIVIADDDSYIIYNHNKIVSQGRVVYSNIDAYSFYFDPHSSLGSSINPNQIENEKTNEVYWRK